MSDSISVDVTPTESLFDEIIEIAVHGLAPNQRVDVITEMAFKGAQWQAEATFEADRDGSVNLTETAPVSGSYEGVRSMGLFQFMEQVGTAPTNDRWVAEGRVTVEDDGTLASRTFKRRIKSPNVTVSAVDHDDLVGKLFNPSTPKTKSPIVFLAGSKPGIPDDIIVPLLASRGYPVLALAYYGANGLSEDLAKIPVEYFQVAGRWLLDQFDESDGRMSLIGKGRGADLTLFLGSHIEEVEAVIAYNASSVLLDGVPNGVYEPGSMLLYDGEPIPSISSVFGLRTMFRAIRALVTRDTLSLRPIYTAGLEASSEDVIREATIPVENINGSVLMVTGADDQTRNTPELSAIAEQRLDEKSFGENYEHCKYERAGYDIRAPYQPVSGREFGGNILPGLAADFGGTPEGYADADIDAWSRVLDTLQQATAED